MAQNIEIVGIEIMKNVSDAWESVKHNKACFFWSKRRKHTRKHSFISLIMLLLNTERVCRIHCTWIPKSKLFIKSEEQRSPPKRIPCRKKETFMSLPLFFFYLLSWTFIGKILLLYTNPRNRSSMKDLKNRLANIDPGHVQRSQIFSPIQPPPKSTTTGYSHILKQTVPLKWQRVVSRSVLLCTDGTLSVLGEFQPHRNPSIRLEWLSFEKLESFLVCWMRSVIPSQL